MKHAMVLCLVLTLSGVAAAETRHDFTAVTLDGDSLSLADFRGRVVLVEFWASWCPPCREQLPHTAALEDELDDLVVLAVSVDTRRERVERFAERVRLPRRVLLDPEGHIAARFALEAMPWAVLVDRDGTVLWEGSRISDGRRTLDEAVGRVRRSE